MPAKSESLSLPAEYQERPSFVRLCVTLPPELGDYVRLQSRRYPGLRSGANQSAFLRDLVLAHRNAFAKKRRKA